MRQKYNYQIVKKFIESNNYKLLSNEYKNYGDKLEIECPYNHKYNASFAKFKMGRRCPYCANQHRNDYKKITIEKINEKINKIEFDGIQHYQHIPKYGTKEDFEIKQQYDNVKNEYCLKNNIKLEYHIGILIISKQL